jgi:hypothetical protein
MSNNLQYTENLSYEGLILDACNVNGKNKNCDKRAMEKSSAVLFVL